MICSITAVVALTCPGCSWPAGVRSGSLPDPVRGHLYARTDQNAGYASNLAAAKLDHSREITHPDLYTHHLIRLPHSGWAECGSKVSDRAQGRPRAGWLWPVAAPPEG